MPKPKARLESQQAEIIEQIQLIRRTARDESLRAQQTREPLDDKEAIRRRERIAQLHASLMTVQGELGETNRTIRSRKTGQITEGRARARREMEERHNDFLVMFHRVASDSLDPRQVKVFEDAARALLKEADRMGIVEGETTSS